MCSGKIKVCPSIYAYHPRPAFVRRFPSKNPALYCIHVHSFGPQTMHAVCASTLYNHTTSPSHRPAHCKFATIESQKGRDEYTTLTCHLGLPKCPYMHA